MNITLFGRFLVENVSGYISDARKEFEITIISNKIMIAVLQTTAIANTAIWS